MDSPFKADILEGKVALVTGRGPGIGYGISLQLGKHGACLAIMGRGKHVLDPAVAALPSHCILQLLIALPEAWDWIGPFGGQIMTFDSMTLQPAHPQPSSWKKISGPTKD